MLTSCVVVSVNQEVPYFHVEWEDGGYAQVIEQEELFPRDFGVSVICGMIGIDPPKFNRHASKPSVDEEKKKVPSDFFQIKCVIPNSCLIRNS